MGKNGSKESRLRFLILVGIIFSASVIRFSYYGATYFYQLDDYIQYYGFPNYESTWAAIKSINLLANRPLAGLMDAYVWSSLFDNMWVAVVILAGLMTASAFIFRSILQRHFKVYPFFLIVFCLLPLGFEGTYWVSASARVVCALFFTALSGFMLQLYAEKGRIYQLILYLFFQLLCFGFYEQAVPLSLTLTAIIIFLNRKALKRRCLFGLLSLPNVLLYFGICGLLSGDTGYSSRAEFILPTSSYYFNVFLPSLMGQLKAAFLSSGFYITVKGALRGLNIIVSDTAVLYGLATLALCVGIAVFIILSDKKVRGEKQKISSSLMYLLTGILLTAAPVSLFFITTNTWFSVRGTVMSFLGIAMIADWLLVSISGLFKRHGLKVYAACSSVAMLVFMVASISELHDYKLTYENDQNTLAAIASVVDESMENVAVLNVNPSSLAEQNYPYHEHIHGVTDSYWALSGALNAYIEAPSYEYATLVAPIRSDGAISNPFDDFEQFTDFFFIDDNLNIFRVYMEESDDSLSFFKENGEKLGYIRETDGEHYLILTSG